MCGTAFGACLTPGGALDGRVPLPAGGWPWWASALALSGRRQDGRVAYTQAGVLVGKVIILPKREGYSCTV